MKLADRESVVAADKKGAVKVKGEPGGRKMGRIKASRGHQALLPQGAAYRFRARKPASSSCKPSRRSVGAEMGGNMLHVTQQRGRRQP